MRLFLALLTLCLCCTLRIPAQSPKQQTVVLLSFDGFRADYRARNLTPTLDSLAAEGASALSLRPVFPSLTFPNHYAIATGQYPQHHGIINNIMVNPATGAWYAINKDSLKRQSTWYTGEALWETCRKYGVRSASWGFPASDVEDTARQPNYVLRYNSRIPLRERIDTILAWLQLPEAVRPRLVMAYCEIVDAAAHETGTTSEHTNYAIRQADSLVAYLCEGLRRAGLSETNIIICGDHGMTDISLNDVVTMKELLHDVPHRSFGTGEVMQFQSVQKTRASDEKLYHVLQVLSVRSGRFRVFWKDDVPAWYGSMKHGFVLPIVAIADRNVILDNGFYERVISEGNTLARHGWDADWLPMHSIFVASGAAFQKNYRTGTLRNVDIAPLVCAILGIQPHNTIDGDLRKIGFLLNNVPKK